MRKILTPELLLHGYSIGIFPMADPDDDDEIYWYAPDPRAIVPFDTFHISKNLAQLVRQQKFAVTFDHDFEGVMRCCAARETTWISEQIIEVYTQLHELGFAHSVEVWLEGELVGGLYGIALGGAFFGESMFHRARDASKVALVHLVRHLEKQGFVLHDTQFATDHLKRFGVIEIPRSEYERRLARAILMKARW